MMSEYNISTTEKDGETCSGIAALRNGKFETLDNPKNSPWGKVQTCEKMCGGVFDVSTAGHGGIMIRSDIAKDILSPAARKCGFKKGGYVNFEEDTQAAVAMRELLDKGLWNIPHHVTDKAKWEASINNSIKIYNPEYWQTHEKAAAKNV